MTMRAELRGIKCYVAWGPELKRAFVSALLQISELDNVVNNFTLLCSNRENWVLIHSYT